MNKSIKDLGKRLNDWFIKINFLRDQIDSLSKVNSPIALIAAFLLKAQLIEFELKQLLFALDLHYSENNSSNILKKEKRVPRYFDDKRYTLGRLIDEVNKYEGAFLEPLQKDLDGLNSLRVKFSHHLFQSESSLDDLINDAAKGLKVCDRLIIEFEKCNLVLSDGT